MLVGIDHNLLALSLGSIAWRTCGLGEQIRWICTDALNLPFIDGVFTQVQSFVTLNYLPLRSALEEYWRILARDGRLVLTLEAPGFWRKCWDQSGMIGWRRFNLSRQWLGSYLMKQGLDWQRHRIARKLARNTSYDPKTLVRILERSGFEVEHCEVLRQYRNRPLLVGLTARKRVAV